MTGPFDVQPRSYGVPEEVERHLRTRYFPERWERYAAAHRALVVASMFVGLLGSGLLGFALTWSHESGPLLFRSAPGLSFIVALACAFPLPILAAVTLADAALGLLPDRLRLFLRWRALPGGSLGGPRMMRWAAARVGRVGPEVFLDAQARVVRRVHWMIAVALGIALCASSAVVTHDTEVRVTARGIEERALMSEVRTPWHDVEAVELGCAHVCRRDVVRYDLRLTDGRRLQALTGCPSAEELAALEGVDGLAREHQVPRRRATHEDGQAFWEPGCVERVAGATGVDASRLGRMLALE